MMPNELHGFGGKGGRPYDQHNIYMDVQNYVLCVCCVLHSDGCAWHTMHGGRYSLHRNNVPCETTAHNVSKRKIQDLQEEMLYSSTTYIASCLLDLSIAVEVIMIWSLLDTTGLSDIHSSHHNIIRTWSMHISTVASTHCESLVIVVQRSYAGKGGEV